MTLHKYRHLTIFRANIGELLPLRPNRATQQAKSKSHERSKNSLRIIGGTWRGRKLPFQAIEDLRPTGSRIRETLFNWLAPWIQDARCLDLFAGSGALSFEALSRGAGWATIIEKQAEIATQLQQHLQLLNCNDATVIQSDALHWLNNTTTLTDNLKKSENRYNIVFVDPPFKKQLWDQTVTALENSTILAEDAMIYIESPQNHPLTIPKNWEPFKRKQAGQVTYQLLIRGS